jgi:alginate O-acetyltransferase complex protein AlgI
MLFPTFDFLLFFLAVAVALAVLAGRHAWQKRVLVAASYFFYAQWNWRFCFLLAGSSALTWIGGLALERQAAPGRRRIVVGCVAGLHLFVLGIFKYSDFFVGSANDLARLLGMHREIPFIEIILPVGISFFTFHGISYIVDVYRRDVAVCRGLTDMLLYLSFFPQLVAGPIVRAAFFLPQLYAPSRQPIMLAPAVVLILGGLFKKVVLATFLATELVDPVFFDPTRFGTVDLLLAMYGYAAQIFCDFSAYSDMAIGLAVLMGYRFPQNFDQPYRAQRLREFWRRWHISLSSWLRDYLYKPLGGSRRGAWRTNINLALTMLLGGLWHGAAWKFIMWGALHGGGLMIERTLLPVIGERSRSRAGRILSVLVVFHLVCVAWIFFRAENFATAWDYLGQLLTPTMAIERTTPFTLALVVLALSLHAIPRDIGRRVADLLEPWPRWALGALGGVFVVAIDALGPDGVAPFIYFQF